MRVLIAGIGGIGNALAHRLVQRGVSVHLVGRDAEKIAALQHALGPHASASVADVLVDADVARVAQEAAATGPRLTGLVYAVGSIPLKSLKSTTARDFMEAYQLNVVGGAMILKACLPQLTAGPEAGAAVFFSSVASQVGFPNHCAIAAAKGAVEAFVRSASAELAPRLRVNCIAPSLTDTPLAARLVSSDAARKTLGDLHPIPRLGTPADQAAMAEFLLDDTLSGWVSGQVFCVDGGRSTLRPKN